MLQKNSRRTQRQRILDALLRAGDKGVPAYELARLGLQYNSRLFELRRLGFRISSEVESVNGGLKHTRFKLLFGPATASETTSSSTDSTTTAQSALFSEEEMTARDYTWEDYPG